MANGNLEMVSILEKYVNTNGHVKATPGFGKGIGGSHHGQNTPHSTGEADKSHSKNAEDEATHSKEKPSSMKRLSFFLIGAITLTEYYSVVEFR